MTVIRLFSFSVSMSELSQSVRHVEIQSYDANYIVVSHKVMKRLYDKIDSLQHQYIMNENEIRVYLDQLKCESAQKQ